MTYEIIKGGANYLLFVLNIEAEDGHTMTAAEQLAEFGPCQAIAWSGRKYALVDLCKREGYALKT